MLAYLCGSMIREYGSKGQFYDYSLTLTFLRKKIKEKRRIYR